MKKILLLGGVAVAMLAADPSLARSVCYDLRDAAKPRESLDTIVRLDVKFHSRLTRRDEPLQLRTYSAYGLFVIEFEGQGGDPEVLATPIIATATVAKGTGTRAGLTSPALQSAGQVMDLECFSDEASPTPEIYDCRFFSLDEEGEALEPLDVVLNRVDPRDEPLCSGF